MKPFSVWKKQFAPDDSVLVLRATKTKETEYQVRVDHVKVGMSFPNPMVVVVHEVNGMVRKTLGWIKYKDLLVKQLNYAKSRRWRNMFWKFDVKKQLLWYCTSEPTTEMKEQADIVAPVASTKAPVTPLNYFDNSSLLGVSRYRLEEAIRDRFTLLSCFPCPDGSVPVCPDSIAFRRSNGNMLFGVHAVRDALREENCVDWKNGPCLDLYNIVDPVMDRATFEMYKRFFFMNPGSISYKAWWVKHECMLLRSRMSVGQETHASVAHLASLVGDLSGIPIDVVDNFLEYEMDMEDQDCKDVSSCGHVNCGLAACYFESIDKTGPLFLVSCPFPYLLGHVQRRDFMLFYGTMVMTSKTLLNAYIGLFEAKIWSEMTHIRSLRSIQTKLLSSPGQHYHGPTVTRELATYLRSACLEEVPMDVDSMTDTSIRTDVRAPPSNVMPLFGLVGSMYVADTDSPLEIPTDCDDGYIRTMLDIIRPYLHPWYRKHVIWKRPRDPDMKREKANEYALYGRTNIKRPCLHSIGRLTHSRCPTLKVHESNNFMIKVCKKGGKTKVVYYCLSTLCKPLGFHELLPFK